MRTLAWLGACLAVVASASSPSPAGAVPNLLQYQFAGDGWRRGAVALGLVSLLNAPIARGGARAGFAPISGSTSSAARVLRSESGSSAALGVSSGGNRRLIGGLLGALAVADTQPTPVVTDSGAIAISTSARAIAMVGVPLVLANPAPTAVLSSLGAPSDTTWRLGRWYAPDSLYHDAAAGTVGPLAPGIGYWLITQTAHTVPLVGQDVPRDTFRVVLDGGPAGRPGWNQLANPFRFAVSVAQLRVTRNAESYALADTANALTERSIRTWNASTGAYASAGVLPAGAGFWIKRLGTGTIRLVVPPVAATEPPAVTMPPPIGSDWAVAIVAHQGDRAAEPLTLGTARGAGAGWNPMCASRPPSPPGRFLSLHVPRPAWGERSGDYVQDIRGPDATTSWDLALSGAEAPGEVRLTATSLALPSGARLVLSDPRDGWSRELEPGAPLTLAAAREARTLRLQIVLPGGPGLPNAPADGLTRVAPSPFSSSTGITLSMARGGDLAIEMFDAQGRRLRKIERRAAGPGEHVLVWDGRDAQGRPMPPGVYLARWHAGKAEGTTRIVKVE